MPDPRVLLAVPVSRDAYEKGGGQNLHFPNIGLAYVGAYLQAQGTEVRLFDGVAEPSFDALGKVVDEFRPTHLGLTSFTVNVKSAERTARFVKERSPGVLATLGGSHAIGAPRESLEEFTSLDHVVSGEGELAYHQLVTSGGVPEAIDAIGGLAHRRDGRVVLNPAGPDLELDALPPPAWSLFELDRYRLLPFRHEARPSGGREFPVLTARGCPFRCTYCSHSLGFKVRKRPVASVIAEVESLIRDHRAEAVFFCTETFTVDRAYAEALCRALIAAGIDRRVYWGCTTRVDTLDPSLIALMRRAGCSYISMGLESGTQEVLDTVERGHKVTDVDRVIRAIHAEGMAVHSNFLIGIPGETPSTIRATIESAVRLRIDFASFCVFMPFPGAALSRALDADQRFRVLTRDWDLYRTQSGRYLIANPFLSERQVHWLHLWAYLRFYVRWGYARRMLKMVSLKSMVLYALDHARHALDGWFRTLEPQAA